ncbi:MAG: hypothetical protein RR577_05365 [Erysipelotrichales bacterium]
MTYIICIILFVMAYSDYKSGLVSNLYFLPLLCFIELKIVVFVLFLITLFLFKYIKGYIGGADIKLCFIFLLIYPYSFVLYWLFIACLLALCYSKLNSLKEVRLFPFFYISYLVLIMYREVFI